MLRWMFEKMEDASVFGSDVVITICQDLQDHVDAMGAGDRAVLIENVMGGDVEEPPTMSAASVRQRGRSIRRRRSSSTRARSSRIRAWICCSTRWRSWRRLGRPCVCSSSAAVPSRSRRARARRGGGGAGDLHRTSAGARDPGVCRGRRHPRVAAHRRNEHAAQDLLVPARGQADRRHRSADAHAGARPRDGAARGAGAGGVRRGARTAAGRPGAAARLARAAGERARLRYSREAYVARTRLVCDRLTAAGLRTRVPAVPHA